MRDYRGKMRVPGFVDTHIHYPQSEMVGAYGEQLLEWLNRHAPARMTGSGASVFGMWPT